MAQGYSIPHNSQQLYKSYDVMLFIFFSHLRLHLPCRRIPKLGLPLVIPSPSNIGQTP
jgi:hypothetical protein